jgi:hypothetical protein
MKRIFWTAAIAAFVFSGTAVLARDANRAPAGQNLRAIQIECMKQHGAYYDATRKRWVIPPAPYYIMSSRVDAVYNCVTQRTGRPARPFMYERTVR